MKVRGGDYTAKQLTAKLQSMPPRAYARNARYLLGRPWRRLTVAALPSLCSPPLLARLTGHRELPTLLHWARTDAWPLPAEGLTALAGGLGRAFPELADSAVADAKRAVAHEFDLLGSGPRSLGAEIDWLRDFKTDIAWSPGFYQAIDYSNLDRPSDVKVPWEISRGHQLVDLARAHLLDPSQEYVDEFAAQLRSWIKANPAGRTINWSCTMEVAIRAVNWLWTLGVFAPELDDDSLCEVLSSLVQHGLFIERNLEVSEVAGNHYLSDALGLVALGAFFRSGRLGRRWLRTGSAILIAELDKQVYPDGVDHEMSIPYHRLVAEIFLIGGLLLRSANEEPGSAYWARLERMMEFIAAYTRPDGTIPVWGDADDGRVLPFGGRHLDDHRHLLSTAAVLFGRTDFSAAAGALAEDTVWLLGLDAVEAFDALVPEPDRRRCVTFPDGGFVILRSEPWHVVFDAGPVGLRGRGGHGHNDALAVEVWASGAPLIVDPGSYVYTCDVAARYAFRSTRAHNTPMLDDHEINDVLGLWQLADQAGARIDAHDETDDGALASGRHLGYTRIDPRAVVRREIALAGSACRIRDAVAAAAGRWSVRWTFADGTVLDDVTAAGATAHRGNDVFHLEVCGASAVTGGQTWVSPSYGVRRPAAYLEVELAGDECETVIHAR